MREKQDDRVLPGVGLFIEVVARPLAPSPLTVFTMQVSAGVCCCVCHLHLVAGLYQLYHANVRLCSRLRYGSRSCMERQVHDRTLDQRYTNVSVPLCLATNEVEDKPI